MIVYEGQDKLIETFTCSLQRIILMLHFQHTEDSLTPPVNINIFYLESTVLYEFTGVGYYEGDLKLSAHGACATVSVIKLKLASVVSQTFILTAVCVCAG